MVEARPPSTTYRLKKFVRRHKGQVLAASLVLLTLLAGIVGTTLGLLEARKQAGIAHDEAEKKTRALYEEARQRTLAEEEKGKAKQAEAATLADYRASTDDAIEQLIGEKPELGLRERTYLEKTLKRWQAFAARKGEDQKSQAIRAEGHSRVAYLWAKLGQPDEARRDFETARDLQKKLTDAFPAVPAYQQELARTHNNLGGVLPDLGRRDAARREYETARDLLKKLADAFPAVPEYQVELGGSYCNFGRLVRSEGKPAHSLPWFDRAIRTLTPVHQKEPRDVVARLFLRNSYWERTEAHDQLKKYGEAVKDWDRAVALSPSAEQALLRASRAASRVQAGEVVEAVAGGRTSRSCWRSWRRRRRGSPRPRFRRLHPGRVLGTLTGSTKEAKLPGG